MNINFKLFKKINIVLAILLVLIVSTSCSKKQEKPMTSSEKEKIPEGLGAMADKSDSIIEDIEKIMEEMKKPEEKEEQQNKQSNQSSEGKSQSDNKSSEGEKSEQQKQTMTKKEKIDTMWEKVGKTVEEIHAGWNDYELKALEMGAKNEDTTKFEDALDNLTIAVEKKDSLESLHQTNRMNYYMSIFFDPYKGNPDGEIMRLKYFVRQSHLFGLLNDWAKSEESIKMGENSVNTLRPKVKLDKKDENLMEKLNLSLLNMKSVIERKNAELLKIKRDIVLKNLEQLKEKAK
ncbi:hypothetical protein [Brassicibacter mesophilus]|uniref:hypothetical protein n=1 Tax=Brassicibacter mesophilus TaxID=745119 RepID=UPI003D23F12C